MTGTAAIADFELRKTIYSNDVNYVTGLRSNRMDKTAVCGMSTGNWYYGIGLLNLQNGLYPSTWEDTTDYIELYVIY